VKHRLLLHSLNHRIVVVDITSINLTPSTDRGSVPFIHTNWKEVAMHLKTLEASEELIEQTNRSLQQTGVAVATIV
jgi:hypothetical protein